MRPDARIACATLCPALAVACGSVGDTPRGRSFDADQLDAIEAAMERRADGRWRSWTMELVNGALAFRVEVAAARPVGACEEIEGAVRSGVGARVDWSADLLHRGAVVDRCRV